MTGPTSVEISYSQFAVFPLGLENPFSDWSNDQVAQGFAWRPESVSFRTILDAGPHDMEIAISDGPLTIGQNALRVVRVPFRGPADGRIEIASISDGIEADLPPGLYQLQCEFLSEPESRAPLVRLRFYRTSTPIFEVPVADDALSPPLQLCTSAKSTAEACQ